MTFRVTARSLFALALGCVAMLAQLRAQAPSQAPSVTLAVAGRTNANVSLAAAGSFIAAAWAAALPTGATDIYIAVSRDHGATFSAPVRVNTKPGDAHVNGEQPPRVALRSRTGTLPEIVAVWTSRNASGGTIVWARSSDGGRTFSPTAVVPGAEGVGNRGWENITVDRAGHVHIVWLDHRELAQSGAMNHTAEHHTAPAGSTKDAVDAAQLSKLYTTTLGDAQSIHAISGGVCYCCKTAIVAGADRDIYLAWRHVYPQNVRDMAFTESHDGGRTFSAPVRVSEDKWQIEGCPEDGPALVLDSKRQVHVVWPTLVQDAPNGQPSIGIFHASSTAGHNFSPRERIATEGVPHHPQIALARDTLYLAWDELKNATRQVVVAHRPASSGAGAPWSREIVSGDAAGTYPAMVPADAGVIVAWTSGRPDSVIRMTLVK